MNRFLLFVYAAYHRPESSGAGGGWKDFYNDYATQQEAEADGRELTAGKNPYGGEMFYWHVVDATTREWVAGNDS